MMIQGQEWQDELEYLKEMIDAKKEYIETSLRASENRLILPGERKIIPVNIHPDLLRDYNCIVEDLFSLRYNSWLQVYPFLLPFYSKMGVTMVNHAQMELSKEIPFSLSWRLFSGADGIYMQNINKLIDISKYEQLLHTAYKISSGDEIATLKLTIR